jgi:hypothetical protein
MIGLDQPTGLVEGMVQTIKAGGAKIAERPKPAGAHQIVGLPRNTGTGDI